MYIFHSLKNLIVYNVIFLIILSTVFFVPTAHAQCPPNCGGGGGGITNPLSSSSLVGFLQNLLSVLIAFAIPIAAIAIIYAGFLFVTSRGSEEQLRRAKKTFFYTVIGTAILLGAQVIISVIATTIQSL